MSAEILAPRGVFHLFLPYNGCFFSIYGKSKRNTPLGAKNSRIILHPVFTVQQFKSWYCALVEEQLGSWLPLIIFLQSPQHDLSQLHMLWTMRHKIREGGMILTIFISKIASGNGNRRASLEIIHYSLPFRHQFFREWLLPVTILPPHNF